MPSKQVNKSKTATATTTASLTAAKKSGAAPKAKAKVVPTPPAVEVKAVQQPTVELEAATTQTDAEQSVTRDHIRKTREQLNEIGNALKTALRQLSTIEKEFNKERNMWARKAKKGGRKSTSLSGFAKPGFISPELCNFLDVKPGTEMAHTDVTKLVINYIKDKDLQDQQNRRVIIPDKKLGGLLQHDTADTITFFNLQTYMKHHYLNPNKPKPETIQQVASAPQ
jgi:chromatin remodeling complex protein RSC6